MYVSINQIWPFYVEDWENYGVYSLPGWSMGPWLVQDIPFPPPRLSALIIYVHNGIEIMKLRFDPFWASKMYRPEILQGDNKYTKRHRKFHCSLKYSALTIKFLSVCVLTPCQLVIHHPCKKNHFLHHTLIYIYI